MPRNGSGLYSLPAGQPVVTGTIISSTTHNNTMSDIASEMTNSVDKDGQTVLTGIIDHNGNNIVLDTDGDTLLDLGTDDQVGITIAGAEDFLFLANIFRALSGSVLETNTINETTAASGVTIDGVVLKDSGITATGTAATGPLTVTGAASVSGVITASDDIVLGAAKAIQMAGAGSASDSIWISASDLMFLNNANAGGNLQLQTQGTTVLQLDAAGSASFTGALDVGGDVTLSAGDLIITTSTTPASAAAAGVVGTIAWDASYMYVCTATNTWKRVAIATW